jgi:hypothetical protein
MHRTALSLPSGRKKSLSPYGLRNEIGKPQLKRHTGKEERTVQKINF